MSEISCEGPAKQTCNQDQPSFKAYLSRWMAITTQMAPFTADIIMPRLQKSAAAAAAQCIGGKSGRMCGRRWYQTDWDLQQGVGEQMSALSVFQSNLIAKVNPPVTQVQGGTSKSDPSAGSGGDSGTITSNPIITRVISTSDKAGAGILTALTLILVLGMTWWIIV